MVCAARGREYEKKATKNDNLETRMRTEEARRYHKEGSDFGGHCSIEKKADAGEKWRYRD